MSPRMGPGMRPLPFCADNRHRIAESHTTPWGVIEGGMGRLPGGAPRAHATGPMRQDPYEIQQQHSRSHPKAVNGER